MAARTGESYTWGQDTLLGWSWTHPRRSRSGSTIDQTISVADFRVNFKRGMVVLNLTAAFETHLDLRAEDQISQPGFNQVLSSAKGIYPPLCGSNTLIFSGFLKQFGKYTARAWTVLELAHVQ